MDEELILSRNSSEEKKNDKEFVLKNVRMRGFSLRFASEEMKNDREVALEAVKNGCRLEYVGESLRNDLEIVLEAIKRAPPCKGYGRKPAFSHVGNELRSSKGIALVAVKRDPSALEYVSDALKNDKDVVMTALTEYFKTPGKELGDKVGSLKSVAFVGEEIRQDEDVKREMEILEIIRSSEVDRLLYADIKEEYRNDHSILINQILRGNPELINRFPKDLKNKKEFMLALLQMDGSFFCQATEEMKRDPEIVLVSLKTDMDVITHVPPELRQNKEFMMDVLENHIPRDRESLERFFDLVFLKTPRPVKDKDFLVRMCSLCGRCLPPIEWYSSYPEIFCAAAEEDVEYVDEYVIGNRSVDERKLDLLKLKNVQKSIITGYSKKINSFSYDDDLVILSSIDEKIKKRRKDCLFSRYLYYRKFFDGIKNKNFMELALQDLLVHLKLCGEYDQLSFKMERFGEYPWNRTKLEEFMIEKVTKILGSSILECDWTVNLESISDSWERIMKTPQHLEEIRKIVRKELIEKIVERVAKDFEKCRKSHPYSQVISDESLGERITNILRGVTGFTVDELLSTILVIAPKEEEEEGEEEEEEEEVSVDNEVHGKVLGNKPLFSFGEIEVTRKTGGKENSFHFIGFRNNETGKRHGYGIEYVEVEKKGKNLAKKILGKNQKKKKRKDLVFYGRFHCGVRDGKNRCIEYTRNTKYKTTHMIYEGGYRRGKRCGKGTEWEFIRSTKECYPFFQGMFENGIRHGRGEMFVRKEGVNVRGNWVNGELDESSVKKYDCPNIDYTKISQFLNDESVVGAGAYGAVYVIHTQLLEGLIPSHVLKDSIREEKVAVKVMKVKDHFEQRRLISMIRRAIGLCNSTSLEQSPYLLEIYATIKGVREVGYVMRLCSSGSVTDMLHRASRPPHHEAITLEEKMRILEEVATGMMHLHDEYLIHRDLKWENILVSDGPQKTIKIADIDTLKEDTANWRMAVFSKAAQTSRIGTTGFLSPEVFLGKEYTLKSDVFAFGMMIYSLIFEVFPSPYRTSYQCPCSATLQSIMEGNNLDSHVANCGFRPLLDHREMEKYPTFIIDTLIQCWDKNPFNRPQFREIVNRFHLEKNRRVCRVVLQFPELKNILSDQIVYLTKPFRISDINNWVKRKFVIESSSGEEEEEVLKEVKVHSMTSSVGSIYNDEDLDLLLKKEMDQTKISIKLENFDQFSSYYHLYSELGNNSSVTIKEKNKEIKTLKRKCKVQEDELKKLKNELQLAKLKVSKLENELKLSSIKHQGSNIII